MIKGIEKGEKHSYRDFGAILSKRSISYPNKRKLKVTIPYMNGSYDFSTVLGEQIYDERTLQYVFKIIGSTKEELENKTRLFSNWLMGSMQEKLIDDSIQDYYFSAECEKVSVEESRKVYKVTADFTAYPFKIGKELEGNDIWDKFNFLEDYAQETKLNINGSKEVTLYNPGFKVVPEVVCDSDFIVNGISFSPNIRLNNNFFLKSGENRVTIIGNGQIQFIFRREVL